MRFSLFQVGVVLPQALHIQALAVDEHLGHNVPQQQQGLLKQRGHGLLGIDLVLQVILGAHRHPHHKGGDVLEGAVGVGADVDHLGAQGMGLLGDACGKQGGTAVIIPSLFRGGFFMLKKGE